MKNICILLLALILFACSDDPSGTQTSEGNGDDAVFGWRWDNFMPVPNSTKSYGGLRSIYHVDGRIVLVDDYYSNNEYITPGNITYTPRVYASKIGSTQWDTLKTSEWIGYVYGDSTGLYAGTKLNGKILKYDFDRRSWDEIYVLPMGPVAIYNVYGIAVYNGRPVVCFAGYDDTTDRRSETIKLAMRMQTDTGWADVTYDYDSSKEYPMQFNKGVELGGALYTISGHRGMWRYDGSWKKMAKIPRPDWAVWVEDSDTTEILTDITIHKGKIYVIGHKYSTNILEYDVERDSWTPVDSVIDGEDRSYHNTPYDRLALASDGKHLFVSGELPSEPYVYMGDYGEPYGIEVKGWRQVYGNWCTKSCLSSDASYDIEAIGDTLYVANWKGLLKMPLADLDSAISGQEAYPEK